MKSNVNSWSLFVCLLVVQLVISNYVNLSPFISLTILPAMVMCTPMSMPTAWVMAVAFLTGISTDLLTAGAVGLNAVSLVPVAAARNFIVTLVCGNEVVERGSDFNFKKYGALKVITVTLLSLALFHHCGCCGNKTILVQSLPLPLFSPLRPCTLPAHG